MGRYKLSDKQISLSRKGNAIKKHKRLIEFKKGLYESRLDTSKFSPTIYGQRVKDLRMRRKLTITQFAAELGMSAANLSKLEQGQIKKLNLDFMWLICAAADATPDYLFGLTVEPSKALFTDSTGAVRTSFCPIKLDEPDFGELVKELEHAFVTDQELCMALYRILCMRDPELNKRCTESLRGICALLPEDFR